jgi:DNA-binding NarL/FixJ family response regulator
MLHRGLTDTATIRVAIIDDDVLLRDGLSRIIQEAEGLCCAGTFSSVEEATQALPERPADVLLLDIGLPGISGSDAVPRLRQSFPAMAILMLTVFSDRSKVFASICGGASGYLLKATPPAQLIDAIRSVHSGGTPISPEIARKIVDLFRKMGPPEAPASHLTDREQQLLWLLSEGHSYDACASRMNVSVNTVRNYVRSVYEKLHVHSSSAAVISALRQGLIG